MRSALSRTATSDARLELFRHLDPLGHTCFHVDGRGVDVLVAQQPLHHAEISLF